jgi:hypothetical protein
VIKLLELEIEVVGKKVVIRTHERPHFDEIVAKWLIEKYADKEFLQKYASGGIIEVGIGGGPFDEHRKDKEEKQEECAATLVAKALGLDDDPVFKKLLRFTVTTDQKGGSQPFDIASLTKILHQQFPNNPEKVIKWVEMGIEAKYYEQSQFFKEAREEFRKAGKIEWIKGPGGQKLKMVSIISGNSQVAKYARSVNGGQAAIVIQKHPKGNVQIFTNKRFRLKLFDVVRVIRLEEQKAKGKVIVRDWQKLESEGEIEGIEEWFYYKIGEMLLNGSLTAPDVPPSRLSLERIEELVKIALDSRSFEPSRASTCQSGICSSTWKDPCPWYEWGLQRCRKIRYRQANRHSYN